VTVNTTVDETAARVPRNAVALTAASRDESRTRIDTSAAGPYTSSNSACSVTEGELRTRRRRIRTRVEPSSPDRSSPSHRQRLGPPQWLARGDRYPSWSWARWNPQRHPVPARRDPDPHARQVAVGRAGARGSCHRRARPCPGL